MDFTKLLIGGGLAYGIYWYLTQPAVGAVTTPVQGMASNPLPPIAITGATPASNNAMLSVLSTISAGSLNQAAVAAGYTTPSPYMGTWYQWNFFLKQLTGVQGPDPEAAPSTDPMVFQIDPTWLMPATTYFPMLMGWAGKQAGLSALAGLSGLGLYIRENQHGG